MWRTRGAGFSRECRIAPRLSAPPTTFLCLVIKDGVARPGEQRRGGRGACSRRRRARDRADQPEGRGVGTVRPAGRADGRCGPERAGDYVEVVEGDMQASIRRLRRFRTGKRHPLLYRRNTPTGTS